MVELAVMLAVFVGSIIVGYLLISRVPPLLHTPLMSMTNAISAILPIESPHPFHRLLKQRVVVWHALPWCIAKISQQSKMQMQICITQKVQFQLVQ